MRLYSYNLYKNMKGTTSDVSFYDNAYKNVNLADKQRVNDGENGGNFDIYFSVLASQKTDQDRG